MTDFSSGKYEHSTFLSFVCSGPMLQNLLTATYIIDKCQGNFYNISIVEIGNTGFFIDQINTEPAECKFRSFQRITVWWFENLFETLFMRLTLNI
jgi:hypothetical protein